MNIERTIEISILHKTRDGASYLNTLCLFCVRIELKTRLIYENDILMSRSWKCLQPQTWCHLDFVGEESVIRLITFIWSILEDMKMRRVQYWPDLILASSNFEYSFSQRSTSFNSKLKKPSNVNRFVVFNLIHHNFDFLCFVVRIGPHVKRFAFVTNLRCMYTMYEHVNELWTHNNKPHNDKLWITIKRN